MPQARKDRACLALFREGFTIREIAGLLRWSEQAVAAAIRQCVRRL